MSKPLAKPIAAAAVVLMACPSPVAAASMSGDDIRTKIIGNRVYLAVPFGGEFPLFYQTSGRVDGSGEAVGLGRYMAPTDSGRWWVDGNRLCQRWQRWYDGEPFCFTVSYQGNNRIGWRRDDGLTGTARIGR